jgi:protein-disulfide isomerase
MFRSIAAVLAGALLFSGTPAWAAADTVATVGTQTITKAQLDKYIKPKLIEIEQQRYEAMREGLEELIGESLLEQEAKALGINKEALVKQEIEAKASPPTDAEIKELYDNNKEQLDNAPLDAVKPRLIEYLQSIKATERREAYLKTLKDKYKTTVALQAPTVQVGTGGRPSRGGGASAPVKIIEFSDYECPYCQRAEAIVDKLVEHYGDKVQLTYRDFPLAFHANARQASLAAHCAQAQGKFWEYHSKLFIRRELEPAKLKALAGELKLDQG